MKTLPTLPFLIAFATFAFVVGCNPDNEEQTQKDVAKTAQGAVDKTKDAADNGLKSLQKTTAQVSETAKVKSALGSSDVDTSNSSVETIGKTVYMFGSVPTQAMKDKADKIAKAIADTGYTVEDNLKVEAAK